jgi:hypothetical protein
VKRAAILLAVTACGRIDFDAQRASDASAGGDGATTGITYVQPFVGRHIPMGANTFTDTFTGPAMQAGDAVLIHAYCYSAAPTSVAITAPGWTFTPIGFTVSNSYAAASLGAIAPNTAVTTFTVTWTAPVACDYIDELGDEFRGVDPLSPFESHVETGQTGTCGATISTLTANDAVWAACTTNFVQATAAGFSKGADDGDGDWTEYRITTDPAGTVEPVTFATTTTTAQNVMTAVTIRPL